MYRLLLIALLSVSTHEVTPNTAPAGASKSSTINKLDTRDNANDTNATGDSTSPKVPCQKNANCYATNTQSGDAKAEQAKKESLDLLTRRYMCATIVGVLGAWIGLAILIAQTLLSRGSAERQLRAYVLCDSASIINIANPVPTFPGQLFQPTGAEIGNPAAGPGAFIRIKNTGQTPAFHVVHWGNICFSQFPLTTGLPARLPFPVLVSSVLGPGVISTKMLELPQPLTAAETIALRNGTGAIYVYGEITYADAFGKRRHTLYRMLHHPMGGAIGVSTDLSFAEGGNTAT